MAFENEPGFWYTMPYTIRTMTSVKYVGSTNVNNRYYVAVLGSQFPATITAGAIIKIQDSGYEWLDGYWRIRKKQGSTINIDKQTTGEELPINTGLRNTPGATAKRANLGGDGAGFPETTRFLSTLKWNTRLGAANGHCAQNRRVRDLINKFFTSTVVRAQYQARYAQYAGEWDGYGYGPNGGVSAAAVNAMMCVVTQRSSDTCLVNGVETGSAWNAQKVVEDGGYTKRGLWQISSAYGEGGFNLDWYPDGNPDLLLNAEYNTRAALWLMYRRLFDPDYTGLQSKPFYEWEESTNCTSTVAPSPVPCCTAV